MEIFQNFLTNNDCYKKGIYIRPQGIMVHSTATPGVMAQNWIKQWNRSGITKCVHAFIDPTGIYQTLPWNMRGWHAGAAANNTHIGFEICEPSGMLYGSPAAVVSYHPPKGYFESIWEHATNLCAYLCRQYNLTEKDIINHAEGYRLGIATNHADTNHWFVLEGKTMDDFRADVKCKLEEDDGMLTYEQFKAYMERYEEERANLDGSTWSQVERDWANAQGIINGDASGHMRWKAPMTREEYAVTEYRQSLKG